MIAVFGIRMSGNLIGGHEIDRLTRLRIVARMDRAVRHDDGGLVVLEQRRERADGRLVASDDRDRTGKPAGLEMFTKSIVGHVAADERIAHLARAIADAVRGRDRVLGLDEAQLELARPHTDLRLEALVHGFDLVENAEIALAVALRAHHADRRLVNEIRVGPERAGNAQGLGRAARMAVDEDDLGIGHGRLLPSARRASLLAGPPSKGNWEALWRRMAISGKGR